MSPQPQVCLGSLCEFPLRYQEKCWHVRKRLWEVLQRGNKFLEFIDYTLYFTELFIFISPLQYDLRNCETDDLQHKNEWFSSSQSIAIQYSNYNVPIFVLQSCPSKQFIVLWISISAKVLVEHVLVFTSRKFQLAWQSFCQWQITKLGSALYVNDGTESCKDMRRKPDNFMMWYGNVSQSLAMKFLFIV